MYDNAHENGSDNRDSGDLTKMKETIDLQQFPFAENEKNPILWYHGDIPSDLWVCIGN